MSHRGDCHDLAKTQQFCGVLGHTFMEFLKGSGDYCQAQHDVYADNPRKEPSARRYLGKTSLLDLQRRSARLTRGRKHLDGVIFEIIALVGSSLNQNREDPGNLLGEVHHPPPIFTPCPLRPRPATSTPHRQEPRFPSHFLAE
ncbi:hypothetical protein JZ751_010892 [Albula glossodonta]|uniref:Uncharacterized protein n=1 Tax=Albula glossodonta TaxID=121402 RepID=A0A8T2NTF1_9TELE|nr:hypothetical protein JZ751_010892 [Albula glossodonta]